MDFNISPTGPSGSHPVNPPSGRSGGSYTPDERALYDAYEEFYAQLQAALKDGPDADLTKLREAGVNLNQIIGAVSFFFPQDAAKDPLLQAFKELGDSEGNFTGLLDDCLNSDPNDLKGDFDAIQGNSGVQKDIQDSFSSLNQAHPVPSSKYNATEQLFLDLNGMLQAVFNKNPQNNLQLECGFQVFSLAFLQLQSDLKKAGDGMYNTFVKNAPPEIVQLMQDASSGSNNIPADIDAVQGNWSSVNAGIQAFLNAYPMSRR